MELGLGVHECYDGPCLGGHPELGFVSAAGRVQRARLEVGKFDRGAVIEAKAFADPVVYDWDGDGVAEIFVAYVSDREQRDDGVRVGVTRLRKIFTAKTGTIEPYGPAADIDIESVSDVDGDGRPDLETHGPYHWDLDGGDSFRGPLLVAHSLPDGAFSMDDDLAKNTALEHCPEKPAALLEIDGRQVDVSGSMDAIACARLWGMNADHVEAELERGCSRGRLACSSQALSLLVEWAREEPPLSLAGSTPRPRPKPDPRVHAACAQLVERLVRCKGYDTFARQTLRRVYGKVPDLCVAQLQKAVTDCKK